MILESIITAGASLLGIGMIGKGIAVIAPKLFVEINRRRIKRQLKKNIAKAIDTLNYNDFTDCVYEIQQYDIKYFKKQYNKIKNHYKFSDKVLENKTYFLRRFDSNYECNEEVLRNIVKREIELSLSKKHYNIEDTFKYEN